MAAKVFPGCTVTVGGENENDGEWPYAGVSGAVKAVGSHHKSCDMENVVVDSENKIVTAPAFMNDKVPIHVIHDNVSLMVKNVIDMC